MFMSDVEQRKQRSQTALDRTNIIATKQRKTSQVLTPGEPQILSPLLIKSNNSQQLLVIINNNNINNNNRQHFKSYVMVCKYNEGYMVKMNPGYFKSLIST